MEAGQRHRSKNTMFWRADQALKALGREQRWIDFHRACGRDGLFFDDIDPINDKPLNDVTDAMRGAGYQATAFSISKDKNGFLIQEFRGRGKGQGPIAAVIAAYHDAIERGHAVTRSLESILLNDTPEPTPPAATEVDDDFLELIG